MSHLIEQKETALHSAVQFLSSCQKRSHRVRASEGAKKILLFFRRHVVRMGLLHDAAALRRDGSVSALPFFLTKSKQLL